MKKWIENGNKKRPPLSDTASKRPVLDPIPKDRYNKPSLFDCVSSLKGKPSCECFDHSETAHFLLCIRLEKSSTGWVATFVHAYTIIIIGCRCFVKRPK